MSGAESALPGNTSCGGSLAPSEMRHTLAAWDPATGSLHIAFKYYLEPRKLLHTWAAGIRDLAALGSRLSARRIRWVSSLWTSRGVHTVLHSVACRVCEVLHRVLEFVRLFARSI